ncbi:MAG: ArsR/SmtB family transcription factor [Candidatus Binatia bacterium]
MISPVDLPLKAKLFRGFADPSRLAILDFLRAGPKCVYEIAGATGLSQPNTSAHLACLEDCGLVGKERDGKFIYYRIAHKEAIALLNHAEKILGKVGQHVFQCTRYDRNVRRQGK